MNFVKKSLSAVLAGVMFVSSVVVGTTAFAATPTYTAMGDTQAFSANVIVEKQKDSEWYNIKDAGNYYSFTAPKTGSYNVSLTTTPVYYDYETGKYVAAETKDSYRCDNARVGIYKDAEKTESIGSISAPSSYTADYKVVDDHLEQVTAYMPSVKTVSLIAGKTYYVETYASYSGYYLDENNQLKAYDNNFKTQATLSITPTDWSSNVRTKGEEKTFTVGTKTEKITVYTPVADVYYVGDATDAVVPADVAGVPVTNVYGTANKQITSLTLSAGVKEVGGFSDLKKLATVNLNAGLEEIGSFSNDPALTSIAIPATVKYIPSGAFYNDTALSSVTIPAGVETIGDSAFYNTALKAAVVPATVKTIGACAFGYETGLDTNTVEPNDTTEVPVAGFVLGGYNAVAADYAKTYGVAYVDLTNGCTHAFAVTSAVPGTLFKKGSETSTCALCGATTTAATKKATFAIKAAKSTKKGNLVVKAAKQAGIAGYQIQYSTSKKFTKKTTKTVKVASKKALSKTITGLKSGKKYYVRVRAYKGKKTSAWTAVKSVKVK